MPTTILLCVITSTVITTIVNFTKPAYAKFTGRFTNSIHILLSFALGICGAFAIYPRLEYELNSFAIVLVGLSLGTGATIFYDLWKLVQNLGASK